MKVKVEIDKSSIVIPPELTPDKEWNLRHITDEKIREKKAQLSRALKNIECANLACAKTRSKLKVSLMPSDSWTFNGEHVCCKEFDAIIQQRLEKRAVKSVFDTYCPRS